ncbi:MAG: MurT ligase domain-containing protein [Mycobacteriales bacterium]
MSLNTVQRRRSRFRVSGRARVAALAGSIAAGLSQRLGFGQGSMIGGRVTLALCPSMLTQLAAGRRVVLVSGTNGKTTTSHLLAAALRTAGLVAHNASGSNMPDGIVTALIAHPEAEFAVMEVDELHLAAVADAVNPAVVVLLNLTRDQLDRTTEVRKIAGRIGEALARHADTVVVANADDPITVQAAGKAAQTIWVAAGAGWREDAASCPNCGELLEDGENGDWSCTCGLARPPVTWELSDNLAHTAGHVVPLELQLPGRFNLSNATMALVAAHQVAQIPFTAAAKAFAELSEVANRYAIVRYGQHTVRLLLAKNPAGWVEMLSVLAEPRPLVVSINAQGADGRDTSWLWDVPFERLTERPIAASGERAADLGVRLSYADLEHHTAPDPLAALALLPPGPVDVVANYTAFRQLTQRLVHVH